jgi:Flp pilus assembly protein TadG
MNGKLRWGAQMRISEQRGQSLVELAASLLFLFVMLAGIVDAGQALFARVTLLDAAEEGAMYGSTVPDDIAGIEGRIRDYSIGPVDFSDPTAVTIQVDHLGTTCAGELLRVTVSYSHTITTPFLGTILGSQTIPLNGIAESMIMAPGCP